VPYKGADMLLEAAAPLVRAGQVRVTLIGDGAERDNLRAQVAREGLGEGVHFAGWVKHEHLQEELVKHHVLGFPSIREFGGAVVVEAMALGLVPVVVDYGGPGESVSPATGFAVPMGSRERIVAGVREVLQRLVADPGVLRPMGERARQRVLRHFTWEAKARQVLEVYRWALGARGKPDWGMPLPD
jgi:glycosyltransferase involved in cell wall biosynthesis